MLARPLSCLLLLVLLLIPVLGAAPAVAQEGDKARAVALIDDANKAYDSGKFRESLRLYREVYRLTEDPRVLYRVALNYESLANYQRAREHLELYLLVDPDSKYAGRVKAKIKNLRELEANLQAAVRVETTPPGAEVWIDDEGGPPVGVTPVRIPVGVGPHEILIKMEGHEPVRDTFDVEAGQTLEKSYSLGGGPVGDSSVGAPEEAVAAEEPAELAETPVAQAYTGPTARVRIGPSTGVAVICWIAVSVGWVLAGAGAIATQASLQAAVGGSGIGLGLALLGVGGYFLWIHDWSRSLPSAQPVAADTPSVRTFGISVPF